MGPPWDLLNYGLLKVSDAILDAHLAEDPDAKVACEAATKSNRIILLGEITSRAKVDYDKVVRDVVKRVGYNDINIGMDYRTLELHNYLEEQSKDIAAGVHVNREECGAGDQGLMFGYATSETKEMMPLTVVLSHALNRKLADLRRSGDLSWARPDTKAQVFRLFDSTLVSSTFFPSFCLYRTLNLK